MSLSVAIVTLNEADRLPRCLSSVSFADEVVVVDSGSQDDTVSIAESFGCRVLFHPWNGYALQKQYAVHQCRYDHVLILDADECVPPETVGEIEAVLASDDTEFAAYGFFRKNFFHNRWIRRCGWWPNRVVRLVDRRKGHFSKHLVHERWIPDGTVRNLNTAIEHYSFRNYADLIHKMQAYSTLAAHEMHQNNKKASWYTPISHGLWMFIRTYFLELGILEGFDGFMISLLNAEGSFMKYAKLRELNLYGQTDA